MYFTFYQLFQPVKIIVPSKVIEENQPITTTSLKEAYISRKDLHPKAVIAPQQVVGQFTTTKLYPNEQIITERLTNDPNIIQGIFNELNPDETYLNFNSNDARWPAGLKKGDKLTAIAILKDTHKKIAENQIRVVQAEQSTNLLKPIQEASGSSNDKTITVAVNRESAGLILEYCTKSVEFYLIPDHPSFKPVPTTPAKVGENIGK